MPFRPLQSSQDLTAVGTRREDFNYDFKSTIAGASQAELAKDVAAFANAAGGTILVGASEDRATNALNGWVKLSSSEASDARVAFNEAVTRRCSPVPVIDPQVIERVTGEFVVAINVLPYTSLPVGVRVTADQAKEGKAWEAWIIWVRVGTETKAFTPEQAAMLMIPEVRRIMTLLDSVPLNRRKCMRVYYRMPQMEPESAKTKKSYLDLEDIRPLEPANHRGRWEIQRADGLTTKSLDRDEIARFVEAARSKGRLVGEDLSASEVLDLIDFRYEGRLLRAAIVLFGKTFVPWYPQCQLRMARFTGGDQPEVLEQRSIRGPAFKLLEEGEAFGRCHFTMGSDGEPRQPKRGERLFIPAAAIREVLVNALVHRDYAVADGAVSISSFNDRVEVRSPGLFANGITPNSLRRDHPSLTRNPIIADVFYRAGLVEKWGSVVERVAAMCRAASILGPEFNEVGQIVAVTFRSERAS